MRPPVVFTYLFSALACLTNLLGTARGDFAPLPVYESIAPPEAINTNTGLGVYVSRQGIVRFGYTSSYQFNGATREYTASHAELDPQSTRRRLFGSGFQSVVYQFSEIDPAERNIFDVRDRATLQLRSTVTLPDGWLTSSSAFTEAGDEILAMSVIRPIDGGKFEHGCALVTPDTGSTRVIALGQAPQNAESPFIRQVRISPTYLAVVLQQTINQAQIRVFNRATGELLVTSPNGGIGPVMLSDDALVVQRDNERGVSVLNPLTLQFQSSLSAAVPPPANLSMTAILDRGVVWLRGESEDWVRFRQFDISNPSQPKLLNDFRIYRPEAVTGGILMTKDWIAFVQRGGALKYFDFSAGSHNQLPLARVSGGTVRESAGKLLATITLDKPSATPTSVRCYTQDSTAVAGSDFTAVDQTVQFAAGVTSAQIEIPLVVDTQLERTESFELRLADGQGLRTSTGSSPATILGNGYGIWDRPLNFASVPSRLSPAYKVDIPASSVRAVNQDSAAVVIPYGAVNEGKIAIYDLRTMQVRKIVDLGSPLFSPATFDTVGDKLRVFIANNSSSTLYLIDWATGDMVASGTLTHDSTPYPFWAGPTSMYRSYGKTVLFDDWINPSASRTFALHADTQRVYNIAAADGKIAVATVQQPIFGTSSFGVDLFDQTTHEWIKRIPWPVEFVNQTTLAMDEKTIVVGSGFKFIAFDIASSEALWDAPNGKRISIGSGIVNVDDESNFTLRDLRTGSVLESVAASGQWMSDIRSLEPVADGWVGVIRGSAVRLNANPAHPRYPNATVNLREGESKSFALAASYEAFAGGRAVQFQEIERKPAYENTLPKEFLTIASEFAAADGSQGVAYSLTAANDRAIRSGDRTAVIRMSPPEDPFELLAKVTATVIEDETNISVPTFLHSNEGKAPPATKLLTGGHWLIGQDGNQFHVFDKTTGELLRTISIPLEDVSAHSAAIQGDYLFVGYPMLALPQGRFMYPMRVGAVIMFDLNSGEAIELFTNNNPKEFFGTSLAANDRWLVVGSSLYKSPSLDIDAGGTVSVFELATSKRVMLKKSKQFGFGTSVALWNDLVYTSAPHSKVKVSRGYSPESGCVVGFSLPRGRALPTIVPPTPEDDIAFGLKLDAAGGRLAVMQYGGVHVFDLPSHALSYSFEPATWSYYDSVGLKLNERYLATGSSPTSIIDLEEKKVVGTWFLKNSTTNDPDNLSDITLDDEGLFWSFGEVFRKALPAAGSNP